MGRNPEQDILHSNTGKLDKGFEYHQVKDYNFNWVIQIYMCERVTKGKILDHNTFISSNMYDTKSFSSIFGKNRLVKPVMLLYSHLLLPSSFSREEKKSKK